MIKNIEDQFDVIIKKMEKAAGSGSPRFAELLQELEGCYSEYWAEIVADMTPEIREIYEELSAPAREYKPSV